MKIKIIEECGHDAAILGLSLSYNTDIDRAKKVAVKLAPKGGGHNKFLESIVVYLDITAPRYWWSQFDTYRIGVTKQSESTMHTLTKTKLSREHFERGMINDDTLWELQALIATKELELVKGHLPESFLQRRIICTNYKTLIGIVQQRQTHRLREWKQFCKEIPEQLSLKQYLPQPK